MRSLKRQRQIVQIAKLYYEEGLGQEKIAQMLNLSRPYVSKLLNAARQEGIVRIHIVDPLQVESAIEAEFKNRFSLERVIIVPRHTEGEPLRHVGEACARYLDEIIYNGVTIGTAWGETLFECAKALIPRADLTDIVNVQMCGGASSVSQAVYTSHIADLFSTSLGAASYLLPIPAVVESPEVGQLLLNDGNIASIIGLAQKAEIAMFTAGAFGIRSGLYRAGYLDDDDIERLKAKGAVGDVCTHVIDIRGNICDEELDARTMSVPLSILKEKRIRICVAQGYSKVEGICAILNGGIANVLVTNEETAENVLKRLDEV